MLRRAALLLVAALLLAAPPSAAATTFKLTGDGAAARPEIAVDANGTAHVVWDRPAGGGHVSVYCRVPRGARGCAARRDFALPGADAALGAVHATLMPSGDLVLTTTRSFDPGAGHNPRTRVYAVVSVDGGVSFLEPRVIGEYNFEPELVSVEPGPGDFSLSLGFSTGAYSAAPLDALTTAAAALAPPLERVSVGLTAPTWPLVVHGRGGIFFRTWLGAGPYNDAANWSGEAEVGRGGFPLLAGGPRGLYLIGEDRGASGRERSRLLVRPFVRSGNRFGPARLVSRSGGKTAAYIQNGDFHQDAGGTLHAVFNETVAPGRRQLSHRTSTDGLSWGPIDVVAKGLSRSVYARVAASRSGGGAVVFARKGINLAPFGRSGSGGDDCPQSVTVGVVVVRALEGCLRRDGPRYVTGGPATVNGVNVEPRQASAGYRLTLDREKRTLDTRGEASVRVGGVTLDRGPVSWKLPAGEGRLQRLGVADGSVFRDLGRFAERLFSFPVDGDAELRVAKEATALIDTEFRLPALLGGVTGDVTLRTADGRGLVLDGFRIKVPEARIGKLRIAEVEVVYESDPDVFKGSAKVQLPPAYGPPLTVGFGFREGRLNLLHIDTPFDPTLPIVGAPPEPLVGLDKLAFDYLDEAGSRTFKGTVELQGGPTVRGLFRVSELDGNVTLTFPPEPKPASIDATGTLKVVGLPFATGHVRYSTDNLFSFDGTFQFPPPGRWEGFGNVSAKVDGFLSLRRPYPFSASGDATATIFGISGSGKAVVSTKGLTGCVEVPDIPGVPDIGPDYLGVSYRWGDAFPTLTCNLGEFKLEPPSGARSAQSGRSVSIPGGLQLAALALTGQGGAPRVTVTAPDGSLVTSRPAAVVAGRFVAQELAEPATTYVLIGKPPGGPYRIEPAPGSPPLAGVSIARGLPDPRVTARVTGKGGRRALRYRIRRIEGQRVTFAEQAAGGLYRELGSTGRARGRMAFHPAGYGARKRRIVALVEQDGYPRAKLALARFTAPKARRLARPRRVTVQRKRGRAIVRWSRVRGAGGYEVRINLPRDGRRLLRSTKAGRRRLVVGGLEPGDTGRVTVRAIDEAANLGTARRASLRPRRR
ncbi:MAG TPA: hypothetical protein VGF25_14825 [Thermoleophilaceae bacterium]